MSDLSNYAENAIGNHVLRNTSMTSPSVVYLGAFTAVSDAEAGSGTEVSGGSYARVAVTFGAPSNGVFANSGAVTFLPATANWGTITHTAIFDAISGGNPISIIKALSSPVTINNTDQLIFDASTVTFTFA